ncbi:hypothetical protein OsccyDRAFT_0600 [Leptolyngbyaceae cyanobacterium JSC-12]|nr:hypothetical protein OsccyDRAFT_0600 [Leptolyngbyaceae cyanobacterium JSC-12]
MDKVSLLSRVRLLADCLTVKRGSIGTVVHVYDSENFEVEFLSEDGKTIAVETLNAAVLEKIQNKLSNT